MRARLPRLRHRSQGLSWTATQQVDLLLPWVAHAAMHRLRRTLSGFGRTTSDCSNPWPGWEAASASMREPPLCAGRRQGSARLMSVIEVVTVLMVTAFSLSLPRTSASVLGVR